jgi:hypothetical protein
MARKKTERGQIMILLVFAIVGMLSFVALTIDGGMVYSDRRIAQNAADAAALAGGGEAAKLIRASGLATSEENWDCSSPDIMAAMDAAEGVAMSRAGSNDFSIDQDISDNNGVETYCSNAEKYVDVRVLITRQTRTSFVHFAYKGPLVNTVEAVVRVNPRAAVGMGNSIVSLTDECQGNLKGITFGGDGNTNLIGGGMFSHSCINLNGASGTITVSGGSVEYLNDFTNHNMSLDATPTVADGPLPIRDNPITPPACNSLGAGSINSGVASPGNYSSIKVNNSEVLQLSPGLYCIMTGDFEVKGGAELHGDYVTIYLEKGNFVTAGLSFVQIKAPPADCDIKKTTPGCPPSMGGMLIYAAKGDVSLAGTSDSYYKGTVYAPEGLIDVGGNSSEISDFGAQFIGNTVKIHGKTTIDIEYDPEFIFYRPTTLDVNK